MHDNFQRVFGVDKVRRIGELTCESRGLNLNATDAEREEGNYTRVTEDRQCQVGAPLCFVPCCQFSACCSCERGRIPTNASVQSGPSVSAFVCMCVRSRLG